jgi:hypothetical protein
MIRRRERSTILVDRTTGKEVEPVLVDRKSDRPVMGEDFVFTAGSSAGATTRQRYPGDSSTAGPSES